MKSFSNIINVNHVFEIYNNKAEKTNNFDKYNNEYANTQKLINQKKESIQLVLKEKKFKTLKIKLDKIKKDI